MLDSELAEIYGVETKAFNQAVKRNIERFPEHFRFQLTVEEVQELVEDSSQSNLRSQSVTSSSDDSLRSPSVTLKNENLRSQNVSPTHGGRRYLPYVFTEQGVSMLSAVLRSETAIKVSIQIINAFVEMRRFLQNNASIFARIDSMENRQLRFESKTEANFEKVFQALESAEPPKQGIFFDGQIFDAYVFVNDLLRTAKRSIVLIDNYVDDSVLVQLSKRRKGVVATIFTKKISKQLDLDLKKHNAQYPPVSVHELRESHDRFLLIDDETVYHIGASLKDLGKKWFAFSKMNKSGMNVLRKIEEKFKALPEEVS